MMTNNPIRERLTQEIYQLPDDKLAEVFDLIHSFRVGGQKEQGEDAQLLNELRALIRKPNPAPLGAFRLDLKHHCFDREDANAR